MATVTFRDARIFFGGYEITGQMNEMAMSMEADALDETVFGRTSRSFKGGIRTENATGKGFYYAGAVGAPDPAIFDLMGVSDVPLVVFGEDITVGSTTSGYGYAMLSVESRFTIGGKVGELLPFDFEAKGQGAKAMIIVTPLVNATVTGVATTCGVGTVVDLGALEDDQKLYAGFHNLSTFAGTNTILFKIYSASSSGAGFTAAETLRFTFSAVACRYAEWMTPLTTPFVTCERYYRAQWATSCTNAKKALVWLSRNCADPG